MLGHHKGSVHKVRFSPNGKQLASASGDHTVQLWNAEKLVKEGDEKGAVALLERAVELDPELRRKTGASGTVKNQLSGNHRYCQSLKRY